jgi:hypothetical protein
MDKLLGDILIFISSYLSLKDILSLWQTCIRLNKIYFNIIDKEKIKRYGIELSLESKYKVPGRYVLKEKENILENGNYYLKDNLHLKDVQNGFFIIKGSVKFNFNEKLISFEEGNLFNIQEGSLTINTANIEIINNGNENIVEAVGTEIEADIPKIDYVKYYNYLHKKM